MSTTELPTWAAAEVAASARRGERRSYCAACNETHDDVDHTPDGFVTCDFCDEAATYTKETGGQHWHHCDHCD